MIRQTRRCWQAVMLFTCVLGFSVPAHSHSLGEGYIFLNVGLDSLDGLVQVTFEDLDKLFSLDTSRDGRISVDEVEARLPEILQYVRDNISLGTAEGDYTIEWGKLEFRRLPEGQYIEYSYAVAEPGPVPDVINVGYTMLFDVDSSHRGFLVLPVNAKSGRVDKGEETTLSFDPGLTTRTLDLTELSKWRSFQTFVRHGMVHIWIGIDHILFLIALVLPAVLRREDNRWVPVRDARPAVWNVVKIVTLFTIAHTITLSLAALDVMSLPPRLVESIIAASVVAAALNNIYPVIRNRIGWLVFGFGLFHGFGFASVLSHLIKNRSNLVVDLLGFNLGVELGQIVIILIAFPVLLALRSTRLYLRFVMPAASIVIALLALGWFTERALDLDFLPI